MIATASAPASSVSRAFAKSIPPMATKGNSPTIDRTSFKVLSPTVGSGFALVAVPKIGPKRIEGCWTR